MGQNLRLSLTVRKRFAKENAYFLRTNFFLFPFIFLFLCAINNQLFVYFMVYKFFFLLFSVMLSSLAVAQEVPVDLGLIDPVGNHKGNRAPAQLPSVTYEDDNVFIYAPYYIESMEVVIKDAAGEVIYTYTSAMVAGKNTIALPALVSEDKYSIELSFGSFHLLGYFML